MTSILSQWKWVFKATNSNAGIYKTENIDTIFFCISEIYIKFSTFKKRKMSLIAKVFTKL